MLHSETCLLVHFTFINMHYLTENVSKVTYSAFIHILLLLFLLGVVNVTAQVFPKGQRLSQPLQHSKGFTFFVLTMSDKALIGRIQDSKQSI